MSLLQEALKKLAEKKSKLLNSDEIIKSGNIDNIQSMVKDNIISWQKIYNKSIDFDKLDIISYIIKNKFIIISDELIFETIKYNKYDIIDLLIKLLLLISTSSGIFSSKSFLFKLSRNKNFVIITIY